MSDEVARWIAEGRTLYETRDALNLSVIQAARRIGVPVLELADAEHGRRDPRPYLALAAALTEDPR